MTFMGTQDGIGTRPQWETVGRAVGQGVELTVACLISYALITKILIRVYSVSREDDLLGGMWAVYRYGLCLSRKLPEECVCRHITDVGNRSKFRPVPDISSVSSFPCLGHGSFDWDWCCGSNSGWPVRRCHHGRHHNHGRDGRRRHSPTARLDTAYIAVAGHNHWDGSRDCGCVGNPELGSQIDRRSPSTAG